MTRGTAKWIVDGWVPAEAVRPEATRVLVALVRVYHRDGRATVRTVQAEAGLGSTSTVYAQLVVLQHLGLVGYGQLGRKGVARGSLRPLVQPVPLPALTST